MKKSVWSEWIFIKCSITLSLLAWVAIAAAKDIDQAPMDVKGSAAAEPWARYEDWPSNSYKQYNTLRNTATPPFSKPPEVEKTINGDPIKGKELAFDRSRGGSCVACHVMGPDTPELPGNVGPDLSTIGKYRDDTWLFNYTYEPRTYNPAAVMPPWGTNGLFSVEEIKDIVAFLKTLQTPAKFKSELDDPAKRPEPKEERDNLDPIENMAMAAVESAEELFAAEGPKGKSCQSCHANPQQQFKTWAAGMPRYSKKASKVLGIEEFITRHARATTGDDWRMQSDENTALAVYLRHLANGTPINVAADGDGAKEAVKRGEALMERKIGQINFACTDCHSIGANRWIRGQWLGEFKGQLDHFPTWRTSRGEIWDLRKRFQWCNVAVRADELPPDAAEYGDIELALAIKNNGLPLNVPGIRH